MSQPGGAFAWLNAEPGPKMIVEALKLYGALEKPGAGSNPTILAWADELGAGVASAYARWASRWYDDDAKPWCALFMAVVAKRAGKIPPDLFLGARNWEGWGTKSPKAALGDVLVFVRSGGGHVGLYVGENADHYWFLGGNQGDTEHGRKGDSVGIAPIAKARCTAVRRPPYSVLPNNVRSITIAASGAASTNEA